MAKVIFRILPSPGCGTQGEVIFIEDISASVSLHHRTLQHDFIIEVVKGLRVKHDYVRVGYIPFNTDVIKPVGLPTGVTSEVVVKAIGDCSW